MKMLLTTSCRFWSICFLLSAGPHLAFAEAKPPLTASSKLQTCEILVKSGVAAKLEKNQVGISQAQRLYGLLSQLSPEQQRELFAAVKSDNLQDFTRRLRTGKLTDAEKANLAKLPGAEVIIQDLADINESIPNVMDLDQAGPILLKAVEIIHRQELAAKTDHADLLKSQAQAARFKRTLENTLINFIVYADGLYNRSPFQDPGLRTRTFITPLLYPVQEVLEWGRNHIRELTRMRMVDNLAVKLFLSETLSNGATDQEIGEAMTLILDSPEELKDLRTTVRAVLGEEFDFGNELNKFKDVYRSAGLATTKDERIVNEKFDAANIKALEKLNDLINATRLRRGLGKRQAADFDIDELHIFFEAYSRRLSLFREIYLGKTSAKTGDKYQVEEKYYVPVTYPDGVDEKGRPKTKTVMEPRWRWVTEDPTFENILSRKFEKGDRDTEGLDKVMKRTEQVAKQESGPRSALLSAENLISNVLEGYNEAIMKGVKYDDFMKQMEAEAAHLEEVEQAQKAYLGWTDEQIKKQYSKDDPQNFRERNQWILNRARNAKHLIQQLHELMRRRSLTLTPAYDIMPLDQWLYNLQHKRNVNLVIKSGMVTTLVGGVGAYGYFPEIHQPVNQWAWEFTQTLRSLLGN